MAGDRRTRQTRALPQPLALKYFTRGELLAQLEARGWKQFPASGLHTWQYFTPTGLIKRDSKLPTRAGVDFVLDDMGLYLYVEEHGILDELVREREAREKATGAAQDDGGDSPLWLYPSSPPSSPVADRPRSPEVGLEPSSSDESDDFGDGAPTSEAAEAKARRAGRPLLSTRARGEKRPRAASPASSRARKAAKGKGKASAAAASDEDEDMEGKFARSKRELAALEQQLQALDQRVKEKRFEVHALRIRRNCQRELRALEKEFRSGDLKKESIEERD